jgi:hypothetical protein
LKDSIGGSSWQNVRVRPSVELNNLRLVGCHFEGLACRKCMYSVSKCLHWGWSGAISEGWRAGNACIVHQICHSELVGCHFGGSRWRGQWLRGLAFRIAETTRSQATGNRHTLSRQRRFYVKLLLINDHKYIIKQQVLLISFKIASRKVSKGRIQASAI